MKMFIWQLRCCHEASGCSIDSGIFTTVFNRPGFDRGTRTRMRGLAIQGRMVR
ncbi:MAG TPA: hypothetical protein VHS29_07900 [Candidatus Acidoferrales bacterium]|nr:hypothetical protein [Candidatus Acidoferrales bacterium]